MSASREHRASGGHTSIPGISHGSTKERQVAPYLHLLAPDSNLACAIFCEVLLLHSAHDSDQRPLRLVLGIRRDINYASPDGPETAFNV